MTLAALFDKLQEHEMELQKLEKHEGHKDKVRSLDLSLNMKVHKKKNPNLIMKMLY